MTQNRPPTPPGPAPDESLSARFAAGTPEAHEHEVENQPSASGSEKSNEAGGVSGKRTEHAGPPLDEPVQPEPAAGGEARPKIAPEGNDSTEQPAVEDARSREELIAALKSAEAARDEYLEDLRRTQAEFQNFRKRTMREGALQREQGMIEVLSRLMDVVDDFELAVLAVDSATEVATLHKGIEMVYAKFVEVLKSFGLEKIGQEGVPFDPQRHDAVQRVEDGEHRGEPIVVEVLRPGYLVGGRVLRPAMVKVVT
ncbi:MAG: nucleotide exchange factor GrpE [Nitriliruptorales bacterium]